MRQYILNVDNTKFFGVNNNHIFEITRDELFLMCGKEVSVLSVDLKSLYKENIISDETEYIQVSKVSNKGRFLFSLKSQKICNDLMREEITKAYEKNRTLSKILITAYEITKDYLEHNKTMYKIITIHGDSLVITDINEENILAKYEKINNVADIESLVLDVINKNKNLYYVNK